jgi:hypothetical protein
VSICTARWKRAIDDEAVAGTAVQVEHALLADRFEST